MLRKVNGRLERRGDDGVWRPEPEAVAQEVARSSERLQADLDDLSQVNSGNLEGTLEEPGNSVKSGLSQPALEILSYNQTRVKRGRKISRAVQPAQESTGDVLDIGEIPGLLHDESPRSTSGAARLQKLRSRAKGKTAGSRVVSRMPKPKEVVVPATQAEVEGPDAEGSRLEKQGIRRNVPVKEAPSLLEDRPKWVKELFEAHFRSELAYQLRRLPSGSSGKNRMKLSRQDYAIGWLVMFDKAREDPGVLRLRSNGKSDA